MIELRFKFKEMAAFTLGDESDFVIIKFWGAPWILTQDRKPIFSKPFTIRVRIPLLHEKGTVSVTTTKAVA